MTLLYIAHYFPPSGGGGVQRTTKFIKYLGNHGIDSIVLTRAGEICQRWSPDDQSLSQDLPDNLIVSRVKSPLAGDGDFERMVAAGEKLIETHKPDAILVTLSPYSDARIARTLSTKTGLPWIADLRDPWVLDEFMVYRNWSHRLKEMETMRDELFQADKIIMNTREAKVRLLTKWPELRSKSPEVITNGFDEDDFSLNTPPEKNDQFTLVHTGTLYNSRKGTSPIGRAIFGILGKADPRVNSLARSTYYLVDALTSLLKEQPELANRIKVILAGSISERDANKIQNSSLRNIIEMREYVPHAESIRLLHSADLLFLPMHSLPTGMRATIVPGKTYEYLASGRPILAAVPEGDARDLLEKFPQVYFAAPDKAKSLKESLQKALSAWTENPDGTQSSNRDSKLQPYSRKSLAAQLAEVVRSLAKADTQVPA